MKVASVILLACAQATLALRCRARSGMDPNPNPKKTRDTGTTQLAGGVWWPLPAGFNQKEPASILSLIKSQSHTLPFGNTLKFPKVLIFGDSGSDNKNQWEKSGHTGPDPKKYWNGRVSNGPMWPDYLEQHYSIELVNFAYGGATVNNKVYSQGENIPDFFDQVKDYLTHSPTNQGNSIALVNFVGNDLNGKGATTQKLTQDISANVDSLYQGGIRNFVIFQGSNRYYNDDLGMKQAMVTMVQQLQQKYSGRAHIEMFDTWTHVVRYASVAPPTANGNWNRGGKLNCFDQTKEMPCPNPENFINYDKYHPSTVPGYNMAIDVAQFINKQWNF